MDKMTLGEFNSKFGENRAIASLAVIVEDEEKDKKRIIHDATHGVRVNHRIRSRDKIRAPGAREKKQILRELHSVRARSPSRWLGISRRPGLPPLSFFKMPRLSPLGPG